MNIINPANHELITTVEVDDQKTIANKLDSLQEGQKKWAKVSLGQRIEIMRRFSELLQANLENCASILTSEVGKPLQQSKNEVNGACARIEWLTANAEQSLKDEWMVKTGATREKIVYEPLGVVCNISAWNYPYLVGTNVFVPALFI